MLFVAHGCKLLLVRLDHLRSIGSLATSLGLDGCSSRPVNLGSIGAFSRATVLTGARLEEGCSRGRNQAQGLKRVATHAIAAGTGSTCAWAAQTRAIKTGTAEGIWDGLTHGVVGHAGKPFGSLLVQHSLTKTGLRLCGAQLSTAANLAEGIDGLAREGLVADGLVVRVRLPN